VYIYNDFVNLQKEHSEGPKCKTVSPHSASQVPGIDITEQKRIELDFVQSRWADAEGPDKKVSCNTGCPCEGPWLETKSRVPKALQSVLGE
jgi:hypothetical protein